MAELVHGRDLAQDEALPSLIRLAREVASREAMGVPNGNPAAFL
jgi:hypothetical protein